MKNVLISILLLMSIFFNQSGSAQQAPVPKGAPILYPDLFIGSQVKALMETDVQLIRFVKRHQGRILAAPSDSVRRALEKIGYDSLRVYGFKLADYCQAIDLWVYEKNPAYLGKKVYFRFVMKTDTNIWSWQMPKKIGERRGLEELNPLGFDDHGFQPMPLFPRR